MSWALSAYCCYPKTAAEPGSVCGYGCPMCRWSFIVCLYLSLLWYPFGHSRLLIGTFSPFIFKLTICRYILSAILLTDFGFTLWNISVSFSIDLFSYDLMTVVLFELLFLFCVYLYYRFLFCCYSEAYTHTHTHTHIYIYELYVW